MTEILIQHVKFDERGLIPAIVQDSETGEIVSLYYLDNTSLARMLQTGQAAFLQSGAVQAPGLKRHRLLDVRLNADGGSLTVLVEREAGSSAEERPLSILREARGAQKRSSSEVALVDLGSMELGLALNRLYALIEDRKESRPEGSYTAYLFNSGLDKILKKIAEESGEVIIASKNRSSREIISELADLFYHLLVLMVERDIKLSDVHGELDRRTGKAAPPGQG
jgi:phosphoribosyl-ATP pyrophosphohydrolase/phosphoribosyl-AMP cyclohydrolase